MSADICTTSYELFPGPSVESIDETFGGKYITHAFPQISVTAGEWVEHLSSIKTMMQSLGNPTDLQCFLACGTNTLSCQSTKSGWFIHADWLEE